MLSALSDLLWSKVLIAMLVGIGVWFTIATRFVQFNVTYGSLGTAAVVMAWMFLGAFTLMVGGSLNALIDRGLPPARPIDRRRPAEPPQPDQGEAGSDLTPPSG